MSLLWQIFLVFLVAVAVYFAAPAIAILYILQ